MNLNFAYQPPIGGLMVQPRSRAAERQENETGVQHTDLCGRPHPAHLESHWPVRAFERANIEFSVASVASPQGLARVQALREQERVREAKQKKREAEAHRWKLESKWLAENRHLYRSQWIALDYDKLLVASFDADEVFDKIRGYVPTPLVVRIEDNDLPFGGW